MNSDRYKAIVDKSLPMNFDNDTVRVCICCAMMTSGVTLNEKDLIHKYCYILKTIPFIENDQDILSVIKATIKVFNIDTFKFIRNYLDFFGPIV